MARRAPTTSAPGCSPSELDGLARPPPGRRRQAAPARHHRGAGRAARPHEPPPRRWSGCATWCTIGARRGRRRVALEDRPGHAHRRLRAVAARVVDAAPARHRGARPRRPRPRAGGDGLGDPARGRACRTCPPGAASRPSRASATSCTSSSPAASPISCWTSSTAAATTREARDGSVPDSSRHRPAPTAGPSWRCTAARGRRPPAAAPARPGRAHPRPRSPAPRPGPGRCYGLDFTGHGASTRPGRRRVHRRGPDGRRRRRARPPRARPPSWAEASAPTSALLIAGARPTVVRGAILADGPGLVGGASVPGRPTWVRSGRRGHAARPVRPGRAVPRRPSAGLRGGVRPPGDAVVPDRHADHGLHRGAPRVARRRRGRTRRRRATVEQALASLDPSPTTTRRGPT